jgi:hypothetical protein
MNNVIDALYQIKYNPFKYGNYIASFYSTVENVENNLLLAQLVIPLCSHPEYKTKLEGAVFGEKRKSSIWTVFENKTLLYDLQERIDQFRKLINGWLTIDIKSLTLAYSVSEYFNFTKHKNAENLGKLISGLSLTEIYAFLGVKYR